MSEFEQKKLEIELRRFAAHNFELPRDCRNMDQVRFYIHELCQKIEDCERRYNFVPVWAYLLLAQYNAVYNGVVNTEFRRLYC